MLGASASDLDPESWTTPNPDVSATASPAPTLSAAGFYIGCDASTCVAASPSSWPPCSCPAWLRRPRPRPRPRARAEAGPNDLLMPLGTQAPDDHLSGYVGAESLLPGDPLRLRVNSPDRAVAVDVYRIGHYGGQGGQRVAHLASQPGVTQPSRTVEAGNMVDCSAWRVTHTRDTTGWQPGAGVRGGSSS